jgi:hypothetical protein
MPFFTLLIYERGFSSDPFFFLHSGEAETPEDLFEEAARSGYLPGVDSSLDSGLLRTVLYDAYTFYVVHVGDDEDG